MIGRLSGILIEKTAPFLLLDVQGVGYEVQAPMSTFYQLPELEQPVVLLIQMVVREDAQLLYGFHSASERLLFKRLIKVNGVGPKLALAILSGVSVDEFIQMVKSDDEAGLVRLPGIGKKTAQRLIIEMKDYVLTHNKYSTSSTTLSTGYDSAEEAISALIALGYKPAEASKMISKIDKQGQTTESLIKYALRAKI